MTQNKLLNAQFVNNKIRVLEDIVDILKYSGLIRIGYRKTFIRNNQGKEILLNDLSADHQKKILNAALKAAEECLEEVKEEFEKI